MNSNGQTGRRLSHAVAALITGLILLTSTEARADILATGPVFGGNIRRSAVCYAFNTGAPIKILFGAIRNQSGFIVPPTINTCTGATLPQFGTCGISVGPLTIQAYECTFQTQGTTADLRGVMDIRDTSGNVLINSNLR